MPRDNAQAFVPLYALCPRRMTERLTTAKAPGSVWAVIHALKAYAMEKISCFPSHKTIQDYVGGGLSIRSIERAVKWLEDRNFIKRNSRTSKERYILYIDKHKPIELKTKPLEEANPTGLSDQTRQGCRQKIKSKDQFNSNPKPLEKGLDKQRKVRAQRRPRRRQAVAPQPPVLSPQEQAQKRSKMLQNALDYIAMTGTVNEAHKEVFELLSGSVEGWFGAMNDKKRKLLKIQTKDDLKRIYEAVEALQTTL